MKKKRFVTVMLLVLAAALFLTGCMGKVITEDPLYSDLPDVDPDDGVEKDVNVTLYYRFTSEAYLAGINSTVSVMAGERPESAVIRTLIQGVPMLAADVSALFPNGTSVVDVAFENGILYVTLSEEFLDESIVNSIDREVYLSEESYYEALYLATQEMYLMRRLAVLSIINTIAGSSENVKVQIMVQEGESEARRLTKAELKMDDEKGFIEPLEFDKEILITPEKVAACLLERMVHKEYQRAYVLVAESDYTGATRPVYSEFEQQLAALGIIESYEIVGMRSDDMGQYALAHIRYTAADGVIKSVNNARLYLEDEDGLPKVSYTSLKAVMEN